MTSVLEDDPFAMAQPAERQQWLKPVAQTLGRLIGKAENFFTLPNVALSKLDLRPPVEILVVKTNSLNSKNLSPGQVPIQVLANSVDTVPVMVPAVDRYPR